MFLSGSPTAHEEDQRGTGTRCWCNEDFRTLVVASGLAPRWKTMSAKILRCRYRSDSLSLKLLILDRRWRSQEEVHAKELEHSESPIGHSVEERCPECGKNEDGDGFSGRPFRYNNQGCEALALRLKLRKPVLATVRRPVEWLLSFKKVYGGSELETRLRYPVKNYLS